MLIAVIIILSPIILIIGSIASILQFRQKYGAEKRHQKKYLSTSNSSSVSLHVNREYQPLHNPMGPQT